MPYNLEEDPGQQTNAAGAYLEITRERSGHKAYGAALQTRPNPHDGPTRCSRSPSRRGHEDSQSEHSGRSMRSGL